MIRPVDELRIVDVDDISKRKAVFAALVKNDQIVAVEVHFLHEVKQKVFHDDGS